MAEFDIRKERFYSEFCWLYCEQYEGGQQAFTELMGGINALYTKRSASARKKDRNALADPDAYKRSRFDYKKCKEKTIALNGNFEEHTAFDAAAFRLVDLANEGADVIRLTGVSDLFPIGEGHYRNMSRVNSLLRMLRMTAEIACPSVLLFCDTDEDMYQAAVYAGNHEKPECHLLKDQRFMPALWQTLATKDVRLLAHQIGKYTELKNQAVYALELISEKPVFWRLDYEYLDHLGMNAEAHRKFLNSYFTGKFKGSTSSAKAGRSVKRKEAGVKGTAAELIGQDFESVFEMLHSVYTMQSGVLMPLPANSVPKRLQKALKKQLAVRSEHQAFDVSADVWTMTAAENKVLIIGRYKDGEKIYGICNFSGEEQTFALRDPGNYRNLLTDQEVKIVNLVHIKPYGFAWLREER